MSLPSTFRNIVVSCCSTCCFIRDHGFWADELRPVCLWDKDSNPTTINPSGHICDEFVMTQEALDILEGIRT